MSERTIRIIEVGPRDGLQNETQRIAPQTKLHLIARLQNAGLRTIEAGALVAPQWVPQMADSDLVFTALQQAKTAPGLSYPMLVPNLKGLERALALGVQEVAVFTAASASFCQNNTNASSIAVSLERLRAVSAAALQAGVRVRGYVSCVVGCPYEGAIAATAVADVALALRAMGCYEISLGDTIGVGTPSRIKRMIEAVARHIPLANLAGHYHDTYGMAIANIAASIDMGLRTFDSAIAGLGGCPYAPGASGNVATEDVAYFCQQEGWQTGLDLDALVRTALWINAALGRSNRSKLMQAHPPSGMGYATNSADG